MKAFKSICEFGEIRRASDFSSGSLIDTANEIFLDNKSFDQLKDFVAENQDVNIEIEQAFQYFRKNGKDVIRVKNMVGIIETKNRTTIEILPKIYLIQKTKHEDERPIIRRTFIKMLRHLKNSPFSCIDEAKLKTDRFPIFEIFISAFLEKVELLIKKGLRHNYVGISENCTFLKGRLVFHKNIRHNVSRADRFFIDYDDFLIDIPQNRLIKSTLLFLQTKTYSYKNANRINELLHFFSDVSFSRNYDQDFSSIQDQNRLFSYYSIVMGWVKIFLKKESFTNFSGNNLNQAILFPMERIFEDYIAAMFKKNIQDFDIFTQDRRYHLVEDHIGYGKFKLRPDLVLEKDNKTIILDTKWKMIKESESGSNYGISQSDMYQLFAYGQKYCTVDTFPTLHLVYPQSESFTQRLRPFLYHQNLKLIVLPFDLANENVEMEVKKLFASDYI